MDYMEARDLNWEEHRAIIRSMVQKSLKALEEGMAADGLELAPLSPQWDEDRPFMEALYDATLDLDGQFDEVISKKAKNWDIERIALFDKVILNMAITEMVTFSSIPVKVSINEFIEISKLYSTPKSKQFVNGVLDGAADELTSQGRIRKSGRGLMDNK